MEYKNKKLLYQLYIAEKKSTYKIAEMLGCNNVTIGNWLKEYGISTRLAGSPRPLEERFWEKADVRGEDECWEWRASCCKGGYGAIGNDGKMSSAHVVSWELRHGRKVAEGCVVHHTCGNRKCCNPGHLIELSKKDHYDLHKCDKARGESHGSVKLKVEQVLEIRAKYLLGKYTHRQLAKEYGMDHTTIGRIINRKSWPHISIIAEQ